MSADESKKRGFARLLLHCIGEREREQHDSSDAEADEADSSEALLLLEARDVECDSDAADGARGEEQSGAFRRGPKRRRRRLLRARTESRLGAVGEGVGLRGMGRIANEPLSCIFAAGLTLAGAAGGAGGGRRELGAPRPLRTSRDKSPLRMP